MSKMTALLRLFILLFFFKISFCFALTPIRVLLENNSSDIDYLMSGPHQGYVDGSLRFSTNMHLSWPVRAQGNELVVDGVVIGRSLQLEPLEDYPISWQGRNYRGNLELIAKDGVIQAINTVDLEDYLRGVVPAEMQASWPMSALKAQVIAARTYTLASLSPDAAYDVCATVECQVYEGMDIEHPLSDQAIRETAGMVLTYGDNFAYTYYHSDSGGNVASSLEVWGIDLPYLYAKEDYVQNSPNSNWTFELKSTSVQKVLRDYGYSIDKVKSLQILEKSESGRVARIAFEGETQIVELEGTILHKLLRNMGLKSTHFEMVSNLMIRGEGWGHGVGMSQYGARTLADHNYDHSQILEFYYPGTVLRQIQNEEVVFYQKTCSESEIDKYIKLVNVEEC